MALGPIKLKDLKATHPRLDLFYVRTLRALYKGGKHLLGDDEVMQHVFPRYPGEHLDSYNERRNRAYYINEMAPVINKVSAGLAQDPVAFDDGSGPTGTDPKAKPIDEYWSGLSKDATPPGGDGSAKGLDEIVRETITEGLVAGWGWTLCDMPPPIEAEPGAPAPSVLDEEAAGVTRAYPVPVKCDQVLDWSLKNDRLLWVRMYSVDQPNEDPTKGRDWTIHTWKVWTATEITTYELALDKEGKGKDGKVPQDEDLIPPASEKPHSFKRVPWVMFDCAKDDEPEMHIAGLIESQCRSLFNAQCGDTFHRTRHMFQQLYEFLGTETPGPDQPISEVQENPNRASRKMTTRAPDVIQLRGQDDEAKYVSPDMTGAAINRQAIQEDREAIPRVTGQLALSSDTSGAMIKRSGESKAQDKIAEMVVLGAVGKKGLAFAAAVCDMLTVGRGDDPKNRPQLKGYTNFSIEDGAEDMEWHVALSTAPFKSAKAMVESQLKSIKTRLGDLDAETMSEIRDELEQTITQDSINQASMPPVPPGHELDEQGKPKPLPTSEEQAKMTAKLKPKPKAPGKK